MYFAPYPIISRNIATLLTVITAIILTACSPSRRSTSQWNNNSADSLDTAHKLVPRNFFAIPVHAGETGYFTYAVPKEYRPGPVDPSIYYKGMVTLKRYRELRGSYVTATGLRARELWRKMNGTR